jgi:hypothetical protein
MPNRQLRTLGCLTLGCLAMAWLGCNRPASLEQVASQPTTTATATTTPAIVESRVKSQGRVVALGDVHGDMKATLRALSLAGVIDERAKWTGGTSVLVQTGDILDRGNDEQAILDLFERLKTEAKDAGGAVHVLNGNHELMNVAGDFRYVTPGGFADFEGKRARFRAFRPGGLYALKMASQPVVLIVDDTVFAHGGVLPRHAAYGIDRMNREVSHWLRSGDPKGQRTLAAPDSPVWSRHFSDRPDAGDCALLTKSLKALRVKRMVVGHTVQRTIRPACKERVWRIDVGMASHYGGKPEVLEIAAGKVRAIR